VIKKPHAAAVWRQAYGATIALIDPRVWEPGNIFA
jgi:hypothetical protein